MSTKKTQVLHSQTDAQPDLPLQSCSRAQIYCDWL